MSAGHSSKSHPLSSEELEEALSDPDVVEELMKDFEIITDCDMPYLAGYSKDGMKRWVDRDFHAEGQPVGTVEIDGKMVDCLPFLVGDPEANDPVARGGHEGIEKAMEVYRDKNIKTMPSYDYRHEVATGAERRLVVAAGIKWNSYEKALKPFIKSDETKNLEKVPSDLDQTPLLANPVNKALVARVRAAMEDEDGEKEEESKVSKSEVDYSDGMRRSHCGPTDDWPTGYCEHFVDPHGCAKVKGYIDPKKWCELFEAAGKKSEASEEPDDKGS